MDRTSAAGHERARRRRTRAGSRPSPPRSRRSRAALCPARVYEQALDLGLAQQIERHHPAPARARGVDHPTRVRRFAPECVGVEQAGVDVQPMAQLVEPLAHEPGRRHDERGRLEIARVDFVQQHPRGDGLAEADLVGEQQSSVVS